MLQLSVDFPITTAVFPLLRLRRVATLTSFLEGAHAFCTSFIIDRAYGSSCDAQTSWLNDNHRQLP